MASLEDDHFRLREEQLARRLQPRAPPLAARARRARRRRARCCSRPARAACARARRRHRRRRPPTPDRQAAAARVVHPARDQRRDALGGDGGQGVLTPAEQFFVRNHTATPSIDARTPGGCDVFGSGPARPSGGRARPARAAAPPGAHDPSAFIECAGNGRSFFGSQQGTPARARNGSSGRSASRAGAASRCARCSNAPASRAAPST